MPSRCRRLLVACHDLVAGGGMMRFARVERVLAQLGHELAFLRFNEQPSPEFITPARVLTAAEAERQHWDAVMVPGAGFPDSTIARFAELRRPQFGLRVQHVLNDQTRRAAFVAVNRVFEPDLVLFNNPCWPAGSYDDIRARRHGVLLGAVDADAFTRDPRNDESRHSRPWTIGATIGKNPDVLVAMLHLLPGARLRLFGLDRCGLAQQHAASIARGELEITGPLPDAQLPGFYAGLDCVVNAEASAGWSNVGAEALASAVPLVCTPAGTQVFARDGETALVVCELHPQQLADAVAKLRADPLLCRRLAAAGRDAIRPYTWDAYARGLLDLLGFPTDP